MLMERIAAGLDSVRRWAEAQPEDGWEQGEPTGHGVQLVAVRTGRGHVFACTIWAYYRVRDKFETAAFGGVREHLMFPRSLNHWLNQEGSRHVGP